MAMQIVPASFIFSCDGCGKQQAEKSSDRRPAHWADLVLAQDSYDYQGCAVADGTIKRLLCQGCAEKVTAAINTATAK